ncbi:MAG: hypothetical protein NTV63_01455 [Candidatus Woesearchaeota archaeon]|nr:hypothetical protein [Candidatus Woesearchaeota archaeon]
MDVAAVLDFYASIIPGFAITYGPQWPDMEGYLPINYGDHFDTGFYSFNEIMTRGQLGYTEANVLSPGAEMALTFKLTLPEPCNGDFSDGNIFLWGEAI